MDNSVADIISRFDPQRPFVWQMRLTESDFCRLESAAQGLEVDDAMSARCALIYVAEWYKRRYNGTNDCHLDSSQYQRACELSGIDCNRYIYRAADGTTRLWFLSMRLLGGLAAMKECRNTRLLKRLFLLFRNELDDFAQSIIEADQDAAVFKESILQEGSLYYFFDAVSRHQDIYAQEDLDDPESAPAILHSSIERVYDEVLRDKFDLEWIVDYQPCSERMRRSLRLWLRPEEKGGCNEYLRLDRTNHWSGIGNLRNKRRISISLRFVDSDGTVIAEEPNVVNFENTGQESTGFVATGIHPHSLVKNVPAAPFSSIEILASADDATPVTVQKIACLGYAQLWLSADCPSRWSSRQHPQAPTAVVMDDAWHIIGNAPDAKLPFTDKKYGLSRPWAFKEIRHSVTFTDGNVEKTLWNREGYLQIATATYPNLFIYDLDKVRHYYAEDTEYDDEADTSELVDCIFGKRDINVRKFAVRNFEITDNFDTLVPDRIDFRPYGARLFRTWDDDTQPPFGIVELRLSIRGRDYFLKTAYLPSVEEGTPIIRDIANSMLVYRNAAGEIEESNIDVSRQPIDSPSVELVFGKASDYIVLDAIKPTVVKELFVDGRFVKRFYSARYSLPYILKNRARIHDFGEHGYKDYDCRDLVGFYGNKASLDIWRRQYERKATELDPSAPDGLMVCYGSTARPAADSGLRFIYWDYNPQTEPRQEGYGYDRMADFSVLFQDMSGPCSECVIPRNESDDWEAPENVSLLHCFETAVRFKSYFFIFNPLYNMTQRQFEDEIYSKYSERYEYSPELKRIAEELGLTLETNRIKTK